jgi:hypothetical protein
MDQHSGERGSDGLPTIGTVMTGDRNRATRRRSARMGGAAEPTQDAPKPQREQPECMERIIAAAACNRDATERPFMHPRPPRPAPTFACHPVAWRNSLRRRQKVPRASAPHRETMRLYLQPTTTSSSWPLPVIVLSRPRWASASSLAAGPPAAGNRPPCTSHPPPTTTLGNSHGPPGGVVVHVCICISTPAPFSQWRRRRRWPAGGHAAPPTHCTRGARIFLCVCTRSGSETRGHWTSRGRRQRVTLLACTSQKLSDHFGRPSSILWPATYCMAGGTVRLGYLRQMQAPNHHGLRLLPLDVQSPPTKHRFAPARPHPVQRVGPLTCTALLLWKHRFFCFSLR